jgi:hypothetical protein
MNKASPDAVSEFLREHLSKSFMWADPNAGPWDVFAPLGSVGEVYGLSPKPAVGLSYRAPLGTGGGRHLTSSVVRPGEEQLFTVGHEGGHALHARLGGTKNWRTNVSGAFIKEANDIDLSGQFPNAVLEELRTNSIQMRPLSWSQSQANPAYPESLTIAPTEVHKLREYLHSESELLADAEARLRMDPEGFKQHLPKFADMYRKATQRSMGRLLNLGLDYGPLAAVVSAIGGMTAKKSGKSEEPGS